MASAAYQSASELYNERTGETYSYKNKEEVIFSEVLLPEYAPKEYSNRESLWNAVEAHENKSNSRYARQFIIAIPKEWSDDEVIEYTRTFIQESLVDRGMIVDWAYHKKDGNPHIHCMCSVRKLDMNGKWTASEKKIYALDENGNKIPDIDQKTGEQKFRIRNRNGNETKELLWKRITVQSNEWNSRAFLKSIKQEWANNCNKHLEQGKAIDGRSYKEQGIEKIPEVHEGPAARAALERGVVFDSVQENMERRALNRAMVQIRQFIVEAKQHIFNLKAFLEERRRQYGEGRSDRRNINEPGVGGISEGISDIGQGTSTDAGRERLSEQKERHHRRRHR